MSTPGIPCWLTLRRRSARSNGPRSGTSLPCNTPMTISLPIHVFLYNGRRCLRYPRAYIMDVSISRSACRPSCSSCSTMAYMATTPWDPRRRALELRQPGSAHR